MSDSKKGSKWKDKIQRQRKPDLEGAREETKQKRPASEIASENLFLGQSESAAAIEIDNKLTYSKSTYRTKKDFHRVTVKINIELSDFIKERYGERGYTQFLDEAGTKYMKELKDGGKS